MKTVTGARLYCMSECKIRVQNRCFKMRFTLDLSTQEAPRYLLYKKYVSCIRIVRKPRAL